MSLKWKGDSRSLYKLVSCLMGSKMDNARPEHSSDRELANEFLDYSWLKLLKFIMTLKTHLSLAILNTIRYFSL